MRKLSLLVTLSTLLLISCSQPIQRDGNASWVKNLIAKYEAEPVGSPPLSIWRYNYNGKTVYYVPAQYYQSSILYDSLGNVICFPDSGSGGVVDGQCMDFFTQHKNEKLIWQDSRTGFVTIEVHIDGYREDLGMSPALYVLENGEWKQVQQIHRSGVFVDDVYFPIFMLCIVECRRIEHPIQIQLVGYDSIGVKAPPDAFDRQVPSYKTVQLHGKIKIDIPFSLDANCIERKISSTIVYVP